LAAPTRFLLLRVPNRVSVFGAGVDPRASPRTRRRPTDLLDQEAVRSRLPHHTSSGTQRPMTHLRVYPASRTGPCLPGRAPPRATSRSAEFRRRSLISCHSGAQATGTMRGRDLQWSEACVWIIENKTYQSCFTFMMLEALFELSDLQSLSSDSAKLRR